jgi:outer membrane protein
MYNIKKEGKTMNRFIVLLFSLYLSCNAFATTLTEALEAAYENNVALKESREELKVRDEQIMEVISKMLPSVSISKEKRNGKQIPSQNAADAGATTTKINGIIGTFSLSQNLFRGGSDMSSLIAARNSIEASRAELKQKEQIVLIGVVESFLKLNALDNKYSNAKRMEKETKEYVNATQQRFKVGEVTKTDVARAESAYAEYKARKSKHWAELISEKAKFKNITGIEGDNLVLLNSEKEIKHPANVDDAIAIGLKQNPRILVANFMKQVSREQVKSNMGRLLPSIDLKHQVDDLERAPVTSNNNGYKMSQVTSLQVTVPIFDGGSTWSKVRAAKRENKKNEYSAVKTNNEVMEIVTASWFSADSAKDILKSAKEAMLASKIAYDGAKQEEKAGIRASIDVVIAHNEYYATYERYIDAQMQYWLSLYGLKVALGECTAQGLNLKVKHYDPLVNYNRIKFQLIGAY